MVYYYIFKFCEHHSWNSFTSDALLWYQKFHRLKLQTLGKKTKYGEQNKLCLLHVIWANTPFFKSIKAVSSSLELWFYRQKHFHLYSCYMFFFFNLICNAYFLGCVLSSVRVDALNFSSVLLLDTHGGMR